MALQEAFSGHPPDPRPPLVEGVQMRAQFCGGSVAEGASTHWGWAVVPAGTSLGQGELSLQVGEQKSPVKPVTVMLVSPVMQGPAFGSP